ncbi:MAG: tetratricopeptide repeat protein [Acidobacteria bacterium]|nr:tetratricopeptide repeat protein [Acidobacteriota bacterium]
MQFEFSLRRPWSRLALVIGVSFACALAAQILAARFIIGSLADSRTTLTKDELFSAARTFPDSPTLQALIAETEILAAVDHESTAARAETAAGRAVDLTPARYDYHLLLAAAREQRGDVSGAEAALREALARSPERTEIHWRLANLLLRAGKLPDALPHFARAAEAQPRLLTQILSLVWNISGGNIDALEAAAGSTPKARSDLAFFLLRRDRVDASIRVFESIPLTSRLASDETAPYITGLMNLGRLEEARRVWGGLVAHSAEDLESRVWNPGFEIDPHPIDNFDWKLSSNKWARVSIDPAAGRSGSRSLRIDFLGVDTPRLDSEIRQQILVAPGRRYRLRCFVKTQDLVIREGPRLAVTSIDGSVQYALSAPIARGTIGWTEISLEFTAPKAPPTVMISVKRIPVFSYDEPARGALWLDDFSVTEGP